MLQEWADALRENLAFRHQRMAKHHADRHDHWRWQVERPWLELMPGWLPWAALAAFWAVIAWLVVR